MLNATWEAAHQWVPDPNGTTTRNEGDPVSFQVDVSILNLA